MYWYIYFQYTLIRKGQSLMDIYEGMVKQCNIINFIIDSTDTVVDTNMYTMMLLDTYDITGMNFYTLLDDMSQLKIRSCLKLGDFDSIDVNFTALNGDFKPATIIFNKVGNYIAIFGLPKRRNVDNLISQFEDMNRRAQLESSSIVDFSGLSQRDKGMWQINNIDSLTGLYNRKFFNSIYETQFSRAVESGENLGIVSIDIDGFCGLDELFGAGKSERMLLGISQIILASIRSTDYAVRYGEGEILLILSNVRDKSLSAIAERIREGSENKVGVTVSIGCTSLLTSNPENREDLIKASIRARNMSKDHGGNKVTII